MPTKTKQPKQTKKPKPATVKAKAKAKAIPGSKPKRQMVKDKNGLLTNRAASEILQIHPNSLRLWTKDGTVPSVVTVGGYRRFDPKVIAKLAKKMGSKGDEIINASDAAVILSVHRNTISNYSRRGVLKGYKFPGSHYLRYRRSDVEALAEQLQAASEE